MYYDEEGAPRSLCDSAPWGYYTEALTVLLKFKLETVTFKKLVVTFFFQMLQYYLYHIISDNVVFSSANRHIYLNVKINQTFLHCRVISVTVSLM